MSTLTPGMCSTPCGRPACPAAWGPCVLGKVVYVDFGTNTHQHTERREFAYGCAAGWTRYVARAHLSPLPPSQCRVGCPLNDLRCHSTGSQTSRRVLTSLRRFTLQQLLMQVTSQQVTSQQRTCAHWRQAASRSRCTARPAAVPGCRSRRLASWPTYTKRALVSCQAALSAWLSCGVQEDAVVGQHAQVSLHLVAIGGLLVAQVTREALPAARKPKPPAMHHLCFGSGACSWAHSASCQCALG